LDRVSLNIQDKHREYWDQTLFSTPNARALNIPIDLTYRL
jgi:hypothetical protein